MRTIRDNSACTFAVLLLLGSWSLAEESGSVELKVQARAVESPALKYRLLPPEIELQSGNAATILLRLPWEQTQWMSQVFPTLHEWESRPLDAAEWEKSNGVLLGMMYGEMKRAAFRREATWEYPIGESPTPYLILLPDVQGLRGFLGRGLSARIRYHLSRGELDLAREGIMVGLADGRHLARTPFFVNQLVALTIHRAMLDRTAELISQPNSPNLYWALSSLPDSLIALERAASLEGDVFAATFPAVKDLDRERDEKEWREMTQQLVELLRQLGETSGRSLISKLAERGRAQLIKEPGFSQEKLAAMSDDEVAARWYMAARVACDQHVAAILVLPPREAIPQLELHEKEFGPIRELLGAPAHDLFDPTKIYLSAWSLKRRIAALRTVEAIRHHLAKENGVLPQTLDEIEELPVPLDPLTDKPFQWKVSGKVGLLESPPLPTSIRPKLALDKSFAVKYRIGVRQ
jgi:hypothetical protein